MDQCTRNITQLIVCLVVENKQLEQLRKVFLELDYDKKGYLNEEDLR